MKKFLRNTIKKVFAVTFCVVFIFAVFMGKNIRISAKAYNIYTVTLSKKTISSKGLNTALQAVLNEARQNASDNYRYRVVVPSGTYTVNKSIRLYSNTELCLDGVTLTRDSSAGINIIRTGDVDTVSEGTTGYAHRNIAVTGGTLNGNYTSNTIVKVGHARDFLLEGVTLRNVSNGHLMEVAGTDGITVRNCTFHSQTKSGEIGYEALQLDILVGYHFPSYRAEDLPLRNVLIEGCYFYDCPRGIGSHTSIFCNPLDGIVIRNNSFENLGSAAIQSLNWINCEIYNNRISHSPRGIALYTIMDNGRGTYNRNYLANQGNTSVHNEFFSNGYGNIYVHDNVISPCGNIWDVFAYYENCGISVTGVDVTYTSRYGDGSGDISLGKHFPDNVAITNNTIDVGGYGIMLTGTNEQNTFVENNTITCRKSTVSSLEHHGIYLTNHAYLYSVSNNVIKNAEVNGICIEEDSRVTTVQNNEITNSARFGIDVYRSSCGEIWKNTIHKTGANGIEIAYLSKVENKINENKISNTKRSGINISESSKAGIVCDNAISDYKKKMINTSAKSKIQLKDNYNPYIATSVQLDKTSAELEIGKTLRLEHTVLPATAKNKISWSSDNPTVATVDENGQVKALRTGMVTITVQTSNDKTASCKINVKKPPTKIELNRNTIVLGVNERCKLETILEQDTIQGKITFTSDNKNVADVDENGKITAIAEGTAVITASTYNEKTASCEVIVKAAPTEIFLNAETLKLGVGETFRLDYVLPDGQTSQFIAYKIDSPHISMQKDGTITATNAGETTVTITTYNGVTSSCHITVENAPETVVVDRKYIILGVGKETQLFSVTPDYSGNAKITYTSSNSDIADIDENGNITGKAVGMVKITARTYNGKTADCIVHIKDFPPDITMLIEEKFDTSITV